MAVHGSPARPLDLAPLAAPAVALGLGTSLGVVAALAEPGPLWGEAFQLPSTWLLVAVLTGAVASSWRSAVLWGSIALVAAVGVYYATLLETGIRAYYDTAQRAAMVWALVGLACAPPMALSGWALTHWQPGYGRGLMLSLLVGWLWCEAALIWLLWTGGSWIAAAAVIEACFATLLLVYAARRTGPFMASLGVSLVVALAASSFGLAIWRSIDCAAGKVCC